MNRRGVALEEEADEVVDIFHYLVSALSEIGHRLHAGGDGRSNEKSVHIGRDERKSTYLDKLRNCLDKTTCITAPTRPGASYSPPKPLKFVIVRVLPRLICLGTTPSDARHGRWYEHIEYKKGRKVSTNVKDTKSSSIAWATI